MPITKTACRADAFIRPRRFFINARSAWRAFLACVHFQPCETVLLPAYLGWSAREGSGVYDPVAELALPWVFYRLDARLRIDLDHLERCLRAGHVKVVLLIHYFGYVDPAYCEAVGLARKYGAWVLEDEAHALFTDWTGGACGRLGDAGIFSLHKMLPLPSGGMLTVAPRHASLLEGIDDSGADGRSLWAYDWTAIAERRRQNAEQLAELLVPLAEELEPLRGKPRPGEVPQTFPVLVKRTSRDDLYAQLNAAGFGAVSLYHTMISQIREEAFPDSHRLARSILNLPVHQDVAREDLALMVQRLGSLLRSPAGPSRGYGHVLAASSLF
jgi:dTDP-4-amino-4,6-dideoxygalactose transaminase